MFPPLVLGSHIFEMWEMQHQSAQSRWVILKGSIPSLHGILSSTSHFLSELASLGEWEHEKNSAFHGHNLLPSFAAVTFFYSGAVVWDIMIRYKVSHIDDMIEWKSFHDGKGPKTSIYHFLVEECNIALLALLWSLLLEKYVTLEMVTSCTLGKEIHAFLLQNLKLYQYNHVVIELIEQKWDFCGRRLTCIYREVIFILFIGDLFVIIQIMNVLLLCPKLQKK